MSGEILRLFCFVYHDGDEPSISRLFSVEIANTESVGTLKDEIKAKLQPTFAHIHACDMRLWKVEIPAENAKTFKENFRTYINDSHDPEDDMSLTEKLSDIFSKQPEEGTLNIIISECEGFWIMYQC
ncbi:hypothetical protein EW145_g7525 [Phellinidium pouzarii]|uniref:Crinkler effector protein N-terminal domain-containing protein n=1 Tax=Phellinidium pouzarii TaxID=167371 RepID=A0A4S4KHV9_9AGAM|nr:hypothetical protein EW145_g7525 [Phellinidium pouzarii]